MKKVPWGVLSALCAIFAFYASAAIIICYVIFSEVAATTGQVVTLFDNWWQTALFVYRILSNVYFKKERSKEK